MAFRHETPPLGLIKEKGVWREGGYNLLDYGESRDRWWVNLSLPDPECVGGDYKDS